MGIYRKLCLLFTEKNACFNYKDLKDPIYCNTHKLEGMINVKKLDVDKYNCLLCNKYISKVHYFSKEHINNFENNISIKIKDSINKKFIDLIFDFHIIDKNVLYEDLYFKDYFKKMIVKNCDNDKNYKTTLNKFNQALVKHKDLKYWVRKYILQNINDIDNIDKLKIIRMIWFTENLPKIDWSTGAGTSTLEKIFVNGFAECGMIQCLNEASHTKNSILGLVLSKNADHIKNVKIASDSLYCFSDHYPITFDVMVNCTRRELPKRTMYNYNRADWSSMISELRAIDWESQIDRLEPDLAWNKFKNILFEILDKHVPKSTVKMEFRSPWFDSECFQKCKEKEKLHKKFKSNRTVLNELKFRTCRKEFKNLVKAKMRANLDDQNRNNLTKKFWSYVKSTSKSTRIPELVYLKGKTSSDSKTKADMFNEFFYKQFSEASEYDINISFDTDSTLRY